MRHVVASMSQQQSRDEAGRRGSYFEQLRLLRNASICIDVYHDHGGVPKC